MKAKNKIPVSLSVASVLLCLVLLSAHFTSGMYARYVTSASGGDTSRIAKFVVSGKGAEEPVQIKAGDTEGEYTITLTNNSEVAVRYDLTVSFGLADGATVPTYEVDKEKPGTDPITGELEPQTDKEISLIFDISDVTAAAASDGLDFSNANISGDSGEIPFEVLVTFTQIN